MPEFTRHPKGTARTLIDFNEVLSRLATNESVLLCLPVGVLDIIRKLLRDRGLWRTTYAIETNDIGYTMPTPAEFNPVKQAILQFLEETVTMNCNEFISALDGIRQAILASSCCNGIGPGYISDGEGGYWYGTQEPKEKPTTFGGVGDEFSSEAAFQAQLCAAANNIISGLIQSLNFWSALTLAGLIAGSLIVAFFVTAPPLAVFLTLAGAGFSFGAMSTLSNYINDNRQEWACAIYNAEGYSDMLVNIDQLISGMVVDLSFGTFLFSLDNPADVFIQRFPSRSSIIEFI